MKDARDRKLTLVRGDVVIWGVDIGRSRHWGRAVRPDATAASKVFAFNNRRRGFRMFKDEIVRVLQREGASRAVVAMEPTGPYWFPEFEDVFKDPLGKAARWVLHHCPLPADVVAYRLDELAEALKAAASGRVGQKRALALLLVASESVGVREGGEAAKERLRGYLEAADASTARLEILERKMETALEQTGLKEPLLSIPGVGAVTAAAVLGETGDLRVFRTANQVQKLAGFNLTENQSGERRGRSTISKRGRPGLRRVLVQAALCVIVHAPEFRARYDALKTRGDRPLNKMQAVVAIAMQVLRVMFRIAKTGEAYDPKKVGGHQLLATAA